MSFRDVMKLSRRHREPSEWKRANGKVIEAADHMRTNSQRTNPGTNRTAKPQLHAVSGYATYLTPASTKILEPIEPLKPGHGYLVPSARPSSLDSGVEEIVRFLQTA